MTRRVFIIWTHPLFHDTVHALLTQPEIEVVGASAVYAEALSEMEVLHPDTVIVEQTEQNKPETDSEVMHILETSPWCSRIVRMSLHDNDLWIYHREQWTINNRAELLQIISK